MSVILYWTGYTDDDPTGDNWSNGATDGLPPGDDNDLVVDGGMAGNWENAPGTDWSSVVCDSFTVYSYSDEISGVQINTDGSLKLEEATNVTVTGTNGCIGDVHMVDSECDFSDSVVEGASIYFEDSALYNVRITAYIYTREPNASVPVVCVGQVTIGSTGGSSSLDAPSVLSIDGTLEFEGIYFWANVIELADRDSELKITDSSSYYAGVTAPIPADVQPAEGDVRKNTNYLGGTGTLAVPTSRDQVLKDVPYDNTTGTFDEAARNTDPGEENVLAPTTYRIANTEKTGEAAAGGGDGWVSS